ncbi:hypothetical protein AOL_s00097g594 [Orbilia oligospora ATCC 24927]|uniref:FYVE-type domain-containing protein n=1 Tax=Arthrobotrys oligospora (strain ATCC 24927 / CBS 115.81 / DSM 1491) TaxID=756982 RepID=G1XJR7_ARTOA|nr:hypothetical protein AOL_s00097g594 [Orbilia oligospora ATCC 24927]EGX46690.1 hypothetical protein AOL_s00097g594 [Orbilia oligospora ATCC 24927]
MHLVPVPKDPFNQSVTMATTMASAFTQQTAYAQPFPYTKTQAKNISPNSTSPTSPHSASTVMTTPPQTSPTTPNPYLPLAPRQLHPPKCPMYRPAALRTTERATLVASGKTELSDPPTPVVGTPMRSPRPAFQESAEMEPTVGSTDEVTGPPSKANWKPDAEATVCDAAICNKTFSLFDRRHHCRRCGNIFCAQHTSQSLKLDQNCRYNAKGIDSRVCIGCFDEYKRLCAKSRSSSTSSSNSSATNISTPQPAKQMMTARYANDGTLRGRLNSYVGSYRDNWSWSTF